MKSDRIRGGDDLRVVGVEEGRALGLDEGAIGFAQKPYRAAELSRVVAAALRGERLAR